MPRVPSLAAKHIGAHIRRIRVSSTMTQDQLAVHAEIDSSNIRAYEGGRAMPSIHTLMRIAKALQVDAGDLLDGVTLDMFPAAEGGREHSASDAARRSARPGRRSRPSA